MVARVDFTRPEMRTRLINQTSAVLKSVIATNKDRLSGKLKTKAILMNNVRLEISVAQQLLSERAAKLSSVKAVFSGRANAANMIALAASRAAEKRAQALQIVRQNYAAKLASDKRKAIELIAQKKRDAAAAAAAKVAAKAAAEAAASAALIIKNRTAKERLNNIKNYKQTASVAKTAQPATKAGGNYAGLAAVLSFAAWAMK